MSYVEFVESKRGCPVMLYKGYKLNKDRQNKDLTTRWRCSSRKCSGSVTTNEKMEVVAERDHTCVVCARNEVKKVILESKKRENEELKPYPKFFNDVPIEHVDVGSSTISCEEQSDSNLDFLSESEQPPIPTFPATSIPQAPKDMKSYCRLCLNPVTKVQMICLGDFHDINYPSRTVQFKRNKILQTEMYLRMIKDLMPNFNHDLVFNPVMCNDCSTRLQMASDFVEQCMATQKLIQQFKDTHCPLEGMVSCEDVVYNKTLLQASSEEGPSQPKQRKISAKPSTSKSVAKSKTAVKLAQSPLVEPLIETGTFPPDEESQPSSEDVNIKMESIDEEEVEFEDKYEITQDEISYIKQEVIEEAHRIKTDVPIKTEPEFPLLPTNSIVKSEPCSTVTSDSTVMTDLNSVKQFSTADVSSDVDQSNSLVHAIDLPLSSDSLSSNYCPDIQGVAPISAVNATAFSSVNSQFENGQNR